MDAKYVNHISMRPDDCLANYQVFGLFQLSHFLVVNTENMLRWTCFDM